MRIPNRLTPHRGRADISLKSETGLNSQNDATPPTTPYRVGMRKRHLLALALATVALAAAGGTAVATAEPAGPDEDLLTQKLEALAEATDTAVVAEVRTGDQVWSQARGTRVDGGDEPAEPTDEVRIGSLTKSMISTVVLQLTQEGKLKLDDSVHDLAPGLLPYEETITVRQLLNHTSGVPDYFLDIYPSLGEGSATDVETNRLNEYPPEQIIDTATKRPLDFAPGADYRYSNTGYFTLGVVIERLTGDSVEDVVAKRVLQPAGMADSYLPETETGFTGEHLNSYFEAGDAPGAERIDTTEISPTQFWAAGVTISNPADMNRLYRAMFDGTLLEPELLDEAREFTEQSEGSYGLGLQAVNVDCEPIPGGVAAGHTGGALGHSTFSFHSADVETQVSFTFASDPQFLPAEAGEKVSQAVIDLLLAGLCGDTGAKYSPGIDLDTIDDPLTAVKP